MFLLDTNVISEIMKSAPDPRVIAWIDTMPVSALFISTITQAELLYGIALLPESKRRAGLETAARAAFATYFRDRILSFDMNAAEAFATIAVARRRAGRPMAQADAQIGAIAASRGASLATRNVADFENCGFAVTNPWDEGA